MKKYILIIISHKSKKIEKNSSCLYKIEVHILLKKHLEIKKNHNALYDF